MIGDRQPIEGYGRLLAEPREPATFTPSQPAAAAE